MNKFIGSIFHLGFLLTFIFLSTNANAEGRTKSRRGKSHADESSSESRKRKGRTTVDESATQNEKGTLLWVKREGDESHGLFFVRSSDRHFFQVETAPEEFQKKISEHVGEELEFSEVQYKGGKLKLSENSFPSTFAAMRSALAVSKNPTVFVKSVESLQVESEAIHAAFLELKQAARDKCSKTKFKGEPLASHGDGAPRCQAIRPPRRFAPFTATCTGEFICQK